MRDVDEKGAEIHSDSSFALGRPNEYGKRNRSNDLSAANSDGEDGCDDDEGKLRRTRIQRGNEVDNKDKY